MSEAVQSISNSAFLIAVLSLICFSSQFLPLLFLCPRSTHSPSLPPSSLFLPSGHHLPRLFWMFSATSLRPLRVPRSRLLLLDNFPYSSAMRLSCREHLSLSMAMYLDSMHKTIVACIQGRHLFLTSWAVLFQPVAAVHLGGHSMPGKQATPLSFLYCEYTRARSSHWPLNMMLTFRFSENKSDW